MAQKPLRFETTPEGCHVCISHQVNKDGYFRKRWAWGLEMFHRTIWRLHHGEIPEGYEVDHICGNRACCSINHLRILPRLDHLIHTNKTRYRSRKEAAKSYWLEHKPTGTALADRFGVSFSIGCRWIREWKAETH